MHQDTLIAYASAQTGQKSIKSAKMTAIDCQGFDLSYETDKTGRSETCRVPFDPQLRGYEEVRPRLVQMKEEAFAKTGMDDAVTIDFYRVPPAFGAFGWTPISALMGFLFFTTFSTSYQAALVRAYTGGWPTLYAAWVFMIGAHTFEDGVENGRRTHRRGFPSPGGRSVSIEG